MSTEKKAPVEVAAQDGDKLHVKEVTNAALANAISKARPNPWTKAMFMVSIVHLFWGCIA